MIPVLIQNILNCVLKTNKAFMGLEQHGGKWTMTQLFWGGVFLWVLFEVIISLFRGFRGLEWAQRLCYEWDRGVGGHLGTVLSHFVLYNLIYQGFVST